MKKIFLALIAFMLFTNNSMAARQPTYLEEVRDLGFISGQGLACEAKKYHQFELLARAIMISKSPSDKLQTEGMRTYNTAKANAFMQIADTKYADCNDIRKSFDNQKIFKSTLYADGRIKMYDGKMITPRKPYKASTLYKKDNNVFDDVASTYKNAIVKAKASSKNAKKVKFTDSNYGKYANQF